MPLIWVHPPEKPTSAPLSPNWRVQRLLPPLGEADCGDGLRLGLAAAAGEGLGLAAAAAGVGLGLAAAAGEGLGLAAAAAAAGVGRAAGELGVALVPAIFSCRLSAP